jgi:hypothetical protein
MFRDWVVRPAMAGGEHPGARRGPADRRYQGRVPAMAEELDGLRAVAPYWEGRGARHRRQAMGLDESADQAPRALLDESADQAPRALLDESADRAPRASPDESADQAPRASRAAPAEHRQPPGAPPAPAARMKGCD